ncbi:MAG: hypothetical protein U0103_21140 [Candidatus Obscuribacterales bacterium]
MLSIRPSGLFSALLSITLAVGAGSPALSKSSRAHASHSTSSYHAAVSHRTAAHSSAHHAAHRGVGTVSHVSRKGGRHSIIVSRGHAHHGRGVHVSNHIVHHPAPTSYPEPHADNVQNANSLASVYRLYDRGVNERLAGQYEQATKTLREASNAYSSNQRGLTIEAMIDYELGQAAEACRNYSVAADAYARSLRVKPNLIEASVRLTSMLMRAGQPQAALTRARESVAMNPNDPRSHQILALVLDSNGLNADAKLERDSADRLLRSRSTLNYTDVPTELNQEPVIPSTAPDSSKSSSTEGRDTTGAESMSSESADSASQSELRRARQEAQWRLYQQQHPQEQSVNTGSGVQKRPFQYTPASGGEFYRARVEPADKPVNALPKRESSDFPKGADDAVKTYTPENSKSVSADGAGSTSANSPKDASGNGLKGAAADANRSKTKPAVEPVDDEMP